MTVVRQLSFSGGEISPSLYSRVDVNKYTTGLRTCRNFIVLKYGGVENRMGTKFVCEVKDSTKKVRLLKFRFNNEQTYILEFGDQYMRVIQNGGQVVESAETITGITQANPGVVTITGHPYSNGDEVFISGVAGMTEINGRNLRIANVTANTFELQDLQGNNFDTSAFTAYTSGGTAQRVYEIATPYLEADLAKLNFTQSADVITIVHPSYAPRELSRLGNTNWTLDVALFEPSQAAPTGVSISGSGGGESFTYRVTAYNSESQEESLAASGTQGSLTAPTTANPHTITWTAAAGATQYNVYLEVNEVPSFIGVANGTSFKNDGINPDSGDTPPEARNPFTGVNNYPGTVAYIQQRLCFANTNNDPEKVWMSRSANFKNFTVSNPLQDDDAVTFVIAGRQVNRVKHLIDLAEMNIMTEGGEHVAQGDDAGIIKPTAINRRQRSYYGSADLRPIIIGDTALFVQFSENTVFDLKNSIFAEGTQSSELTIFAFHLFRGYTLTDWDYQRNPNSVVWCVRSDGVLLGFTYIREHQVWAWHRHDFEGGFVENVAVIPSGSEDELYVTVRRTIDGVEKRYIEVFASRNQTDVKDYVFCDSSLTFDGRNTNTVHSMTLSGGTTWAYDETLTLTSSEVYFSASDIGNQIHLRVGEELIRFTIDAFSSSTVVTGKPNRTVPAALQNTSTTDWSKAVDELSGLFHLEGKNLSVFADGYVVASPNNDANVIRTVVDGKVTLDKAYTVIHAGLPFTSDIETLDIDTAQGETLQDKQKNITNVHMFVEESRGIFAGAAPPTGDDPLENLTEFKPNDGPNYDNPANLKTDVIDINIISEWNSNGRVFVRQVDPIPLTILSVAPIGLIPIR